MIGKGAKVESTDLPVLIEYLARQQGSVPDGAGKPILLNICTMCHDLNRIKHGRRSPEEWEETLNTMLNEGAPLSDEAFAVDPRVPVRELRRRLTDALLRRADRRRRIDGELLVVRELRDPALPETTSAAGTVR